MKTKSYNYNKAKHELQGLKVVSKIEAVGYIMRDNPHVEGRGSWNSEHEQFERDLTKTVGGYHGYTPDIETIIRKIEETGYAYNRDVAEKLLQSYGLDQYPEYISRAEHLVYSTRQMIRARQIVALYEKMWSAGYTSIHDAQPEHNGKPALLTGSQDIDFFTSKKDNQPVKILCTMDVIGYQKPRQRTRYYQASPDADLFFKLEE